MSDADTITDTEDPTDAGGRGRLRLWAKWLAGITLTLIVIVGASLFGLNTSPGKRMIVAQIAGYELENGLSFTIGDIEGSIYETMVLRDVAVRDEVGVVATSPEITVDWRPFDFVFGALNIRSATTALMTLERLPQLKETPANDAPLLPEFDINIANLQVERFVAKKAVTGEQRVLSAMGSADIADGRAKIQLNVKTQPDNKAGRSDKIAILIDAVPSLNKLALEADIAAPSGGLIAAMTGIKQPLDVALNGKGDWSAWDGNFNAQLGGSKMADWQISARKGTFRATGPTRLSQLFEGALAQFLKPELTLDVSAALSDGKASLNGSIGNPGITLTAAGSVDLSGNRLDAMAINFAVKEITGFADKANASSVSADLLLDGALAAPAVEYLIEADQITFDNIALDNLSASGNATINPDQIMIPVSARAARITGLETIAGGTLRNIALNGDFAIEGPRILADDIRLKSDRINADVLLLADMSKGLYSGAIDGRINDYKIDSVGTFAITTDVDLETDANGFSLAGRVRARSSNLLNEAVEGFLGGNAIAAGDVRYGPDGNVRLSNVIVRSPDFAVAGGEGFYAADGRLGFAANAQSDTYGPLGFELSGTLDKLNAIVTADRPDFGIGLAKVRANITGTQAGYSLDATGQTDFGPLIANVLLDTGDTVTVQIEKANLAGVGFTGSLEQTAQGPFSGRLDASGEGVLGVIRLSAVGEHQQALINLTAQNTVMDGPARLAIGSGKVDARVILRDQPYIIADAQLSQARIGDLKLDAARAKIDYEAGSGSAKVVAEGSNQVPFRVAANADLEPDLWRAAINGKVRGVQFSSTNPARIVPHDDHYELLPASFKFGSGKLRLVGKYGDSLSVQSRVESLPIELVNAFIPGLGITGDATGSIDFELPAGANFPRAETRMKIANFSRSTAASVSQPVALSFAGKLSPDGGDASAVARIGDNVIGRMKASLMPVSAGAGDWTERLLAAPLSGGIRYNGPAGTLFSFAGQPDQSLAGGVAIAADFSGRVQTPQLKGIIRADKLTYENQSYGTRLSDLALRGRFDGVLLEIDRLTANAGKGTVSASGTIDLAQTDGFPMDLSIGLKNARLARGDALSATATGQLRLVKTATTTAILSGELELPETRYKLAYEAASEIPELSGVRFKKPKKSKRATGDEAAEIAPSVFEKLRFNIALKAPERLYVSGMGLESEWGADLKLVGSMAAPRITGDVELVRGTLGFAGKSFALSNGRLNFLGGKTIDPVIAMTATEDIEGVAVNVDVSGRAYDPQIGFSSSPALPQDEVLARILFGNSIDNLSAIEAVQLAASLNSLRGGGGGLNPLGKLRSAAGIDRLRVLGADEANGRGTALAAGQYLTDDVYVEFITDARGFTATQIEVSLTPALSILSQSGGSGATNVDLQYRKDY